MSDIRFKKILVINTGGTLGKDLVHHLKNIYPQSEIRLLDAKADSVNPSDSITFDPEDIVSLYEMIKTQDCVVLSHLPSDSIKSGKEISSQNHIIRDIVNCCLEAKIHKLVYLSSVLSLGIRRPEESIDESCIFAHSKFDNDNSLVAFYCEQEVWRAGAEGLPVTVLNVPLIWDNSNKDGFTEKFAIPVCRIFRTYDGKLSLVALSDVLGAIPKAMLSDTDGERFILCGENLDLKELFLLLGKFYPEVCKNQWDDFIRFLPFLKHQGFRSSSPLSVFTAFAGLNVEYNNQKSIKALEMDYTSVSDFLQKPNK
ncbi:MAG: hypothetical protein IPM26_13500 [Saprospiraceae bacterium]|nr:hypothetical protein [Saprospiraceae bacterium]